VHPRRVVPDEERLACLDGLADEALGFGQHLLVERTLALASKVALVLRSLQDSIRSDRFDKPCL
jgi:hypothetical protein